MQGLALYIRHHLPLIGQMAKNTLRLPVSRKKYEDLSLFCLAEQNRVQQLLQDLQQLKHDYTFSEQLREYYHKGYLRLDSAQRYQRERNGQFAKRPRLMTTRGSDIGQQIRQYSKAIHQVSVNLNELEGMLK
ncbi:hypothetical protein GCM10027347_59660 [Larkinella harenae]